jgi:hypothetical protein
MAAPCFYISTRRCWMDQEHRRLIFDGVVRDVLTKLPVLVYSGAHAQ